MKRFAVWMVIVAVLCLLLVTGSLVGAQGKANPGVLPPQARVQGLSLAEWSALHWEYILTIPASQSPFLGNVGTACLYERVGNVGLVTADWGRPEVLCEVPPGMMLVFSIVGAECSTLEDPPFYGEDEEALRACTTSWTLTELEATLDGVALQELDQYLVVSPLFDFTLPDDNIFGLDPGTTGQSVAYSAMLMLTPLSVGKHSLHLYGYIPEGDFVSEFNLDFFVSPGH
jgi:hypothetical protein